MKKNTLLLFTCTMLLLTGCSSGIADTANKTSDPVQKPTSVPAPTATQAPEEKILNLGKKGTFGDWKICVKKAEVKKKIKDGNYRQYEPGKSKSFIIVSLSVRNNAKKTAEFLPRFGYADKLVSATLLYQDEYEYSPTELLSYDKDLVTEKIQPLTTENGIIAFEVPKKVSKSKKKLKLRIGTKNDSITYSLK